MSCLYVTQACFSGKQHKTMWPAESTHIHHVSKITCSLLLPLPEATKIRWIAILWEVKIRGGLPKRQQHKRTDYKIIPALSSCVRLHCCHHTCLRCFRCQNAAILGSKSATQI